MKKKSFSLFTTDVVGSMGSSKSKMEVVPAEGRSGDREAVELLKKLCKAVRDAQVEAKVNRATELVKQIAAQRSRPIPDAKNAGPSVRDLMERQYQTLGAERARTFQDACREAEAAYAARNPHKRERGRV